MKILLSILLFLSLCADAQVSYSSNATDFAFVNRANYFNTTSGFGGRKLFQRNSGMILGLQRGRYTSIEFGGEAHWRKISLLKPHIIGATANLEYNFSNNIVGYKGGMWFKRGRINLTYGANVSYFTNFKEGNSFGIGPSVGFRLFGLHLINGYNFLIAEKTGANETPIEVNPLYMSLRYYFPVKNSFTWDRKTMKKKRERQRERAKRKKERQNGESKGFWNFLKKGKN
ncbi:MAG TPA: hypothetical protein VF623_01905 [Segetibacter sp.]